MENFKFLNDCEILLNTYLKNPDDLLTLFNSINNNIQFSIELSHSKLPYLDILITKSDKQMWINIYSKTNSLKYYVSYVCNHQNPALFFP